MTAAPPFVVEKARTAQQIGDAAAFFVEAYWAQGTAIEPMDLSENQRAEIARQQRIDMEERYGELVGSRRLNSALYVSRPSANAPINGVVGFEIAVIDMHAAEILSRRRGEGLFKNALMEMGARDRNALRKAPLKDLAAQLLPVGHIVSPVLSNLAVARESRRSGLAQSLCRVCEEAALENGFDSIFLQVEEDNAPASRLYTKLGYKEEWRVEDAPATRVEVDPNGGCRLKTVGTTLLGMRKSL